MKNNHANRPKLGLTSKILIAMLAGIVLGTLLNMLPRHDYIEWYLIDGLLDIGGKVFITVLKMLVVPIVFVSLICGTCNLKSTSRFGSLALKTIILYICTTAIAVSLAIIVANLFNIGADAHWTLSATYAPQDTPSLKETFLNIFPSNPVAALAAGNMIHPLVWQCRPTHQCFL